MKFLFSLFIFVSFTQSSFAKNCGVFLSHGYDESLSVTDNFIAYMHNLLEKNYIDSNYLQNPLTNPLNSKTLNSDQEIHRDTIQSYLDSDQLDKDKIQKWAKKKLQITRVVETSKAASKEDTQSAAVPMRFHEIPKGEFLIGMDKIKISVEEPFQLMQTHLTQWAWVEILKIAGQPAVNPSHNQKQDTTDHPVENISWNDTKAWIDSLNKLSKSPDPAVHKALQNVIIDHRPNDIYDFPNVNQLLYVNSNLGAYGDRLYFDQFNADEAHKYYWFNRNSDSTKTVAELLPRIVNKHPFYDLRGNVNTWTKSKYDDVMDVFKRPQDKRNSAYYAFFGASFVDTYMQLELPRVGYAGHSDQKITTIGLRLVRYRK